MIDMIADYCRRAKAKHTPEDIAYIISQNHVLHDENGFICFAPVLDEIHMLFAYAAPGKSIRPLKDRLETSAKEAGFKRTKFSTDRPEVFGRLFPDYKPIATLFGKELI
jgi:hypothetical protein